MSQETNDALCAVLIISGIGMAFLVGGILQEKFGNAGITFGGSVLTFIATPFIINFFFPLTFGDG